MRQDGYFTVNVIYLPCFIIHRIFSSLNGQRLVSPSYQCRKCIPHTNRSKNEKTKNPGLFHHPGLHAARPAQQNNRCKGRSGRPFHHFHPGKQNRSYRHSSQHGKPISVQACRRMFVQNGFGKTCGLLQIEELGCLETPIALTNTLNVGLVSDALISHTIQSCEKEGVTVHSVNPVVGECNDSRINNICRRAVNESHVKEALEHACADFEEGSVGAGRGTVCYGFKGGIGSASRLIPLDGKIYTLGVLVQSNFGATRYFTIQGRKVGGELLNATDNFTKVIPTADDQGSIMMIIATDLPVSDRQLKRIIGAPPTAWPAPDPIPGTAAGKS